MTDSSQARYTEARQVYPGFQTGTLNILSQFEITTYPHSSNFPRLRLTNHPHSPLCAVSLPLPPLPSLPSFFRHPKLYQYSQPSHTNEAHRPPCILLIEHAEKG